MTAIKCICFLSTITLSSFAQGFFSYDQQSSTEANISGALGIQANQPMGQSFTPTLSSVGFIRLYFYDPNPHNSLGATVHVNLRSDSITGPIIGVSQEVTLIDGFASVTDLMFNTPPVVTPGLTYYFQPVVDSGDAFGTAVYHYNYGGGTMIELGQPYTPVDMWFREGIIVPEPSTAAFALLGGLTWLCLLGKRKGICNSRGRPLGEVRPAV